MMPRAAARGYLQRLAEGGFKGGIPPAATRRPSGRLPPRAARSAVRDEWRGPARTQERYEHILSTEVITCKTLGLSTRGEGWQSG
jgi:hypothetical protein